MKLPENREILEIVPNWESIPIDKLWLLLSLNKILVSLNSKKLICPYCCHYGTVEDHERLEIICPECGLVIGDETIPPEVRLKIVLAFLQELNYPN